MRNIFSCSLWQRFSLKAILNVHKRTHTGEKPFACVVCGQRFSHKISLKRHKKDTLVKKTSCSICDLSFSWKYQAKNHKCVIEMSSDQWSFGLSSEQATSRHAPKMTEFYAPLARLLKFSFSLSEWNVWNFCVKISLSCHLVHISFVFVLSFGFEIWFYFS